MLLQIVRDALWPLGRRDTNTWSTAYQHYYIELFLLYQNRHHRRRRRFEHDISIFDNEHVEMASISIITPIMSLWFDRCYQMIWAHVTSYFIIRREMLNLLRFYLKSNLFLFVFEYLLILFQFLKPGHWPSG